jgi:hypothetical protein
MLAVESQTARHRDLTCLGRIEPVHITKTLREDHFHWKSRTW